MFAVPFTVSAAASGSFSLSGNTVQGPNANLDTVQFFDALGAVPASDIQFVGPGPSGGAIAVLASQAPAITSAGSTTFKVGASGSFSVTTTGFPTSTLSESGALPGGVTFTNNGNGTATLAGTPAAGSGGTYPITITANNGVSPNATQSFTLTVDQAPAITSAGSTTFTVGAPGSFSVTTTGFPTSTLSESGTLPGGVTFTDNGNGTATLAGTPAAGSGGTYLHHHHGQQRRLAQCHAELHAHREFGDFGSARQQRQPHVGTNGRRRTGNHHGHKPGHRRHGHREVRHCPGARPRQRHPDRGHESSGRGRHGRRDRDSLGLHFGNVVGRSVRLFLAVPTQLIFSTGISDAYRRHTLRHNHRAAQGCRRQCGKNLDYSLTVGLKSSSSAGVFLGTGGSPITSVTIPAGSGAASFTYTDTVAAAHAHGQPRRRQRLQSGHAGGNRRGRRRHEAGLHDGGADDFAALSAPITVEFQDQYGNLATFLDSGAVVLSSSSGTGSFYDTSGNPLSNFVIPTGGFASFEYKDTAAGSPMLTAPTTLRGSPAPRRRRL